MRRRREGVLIMTKTTKIVLAAAAALLIALLGAYLWIEYGGGSDDSDRGLTVEEQSPRIEQNSGGASDQTADEISAPAPQKETSVSDEFAAAESAVSSDDSGSAGATQPDAPQAAPQDPFTVELQDALAEFKELIQRFVELHPGPGTTEVAALANEVVDSVAEYNEELQDQNLELGERAARLAERLDETAEQLSPQASEEQEAYKRFFEFFENNPPRKLFALLRVPLPESK